MSHRHRERRRGHDELNRADYRGDFGPEGYRYFDAPEGDRERGYREGHPGRRRSSRDRDDTPDPDRSRNEPTAGRWHWDRQGREGWQRSRISGGYGSQYDAWRQGAGFAQAGFGFGPSEHPVRGGFEDDDWQVTRPARGRGTWAGDWENEEAARHAAHEDYRGRGPRDYRRSDERIRDDACERLTEDWSVDATNIQVRVHDGEVVLSGTVGSREQKRRAGECVESVAGVHDILNQLRVSRDDVREERGGAVGRSSVAADRGGRG